MTDSLPFRLLRRVGSFPAVLIITGLLLGGISAVQSVTEFVSQPPDQFIDVLLARLSGGR